MTVEIAKLIELRDAAEAAAREDQPETTEEGMLRLAMAHAVRRVSVGGGGLLERHALLEELWASMNATGHLQHTQYPCAACKRRDAAMAALRASEAP